MEGRGAVCTHLQTRYTSKNIGQNNTVNSLIFAGINVCVFQTKPCLQGLIFVVSLGLVV